MRRIRVMVVDDSALMRKLITEMLEKDSEIEVVGTAMDGLFALKKIPLAKPDVITLDVDMPRMDGLTALRYIVNDYNVPVVLVSSLTTQGGRSPSRGLHSVRLISSLSRTTRFRCTFTRSRPIL